MDPADFGVHTPHTLRRWECTHTHTHTHTETHKHTHRTCMSAKGGKKIAPRRGLGVGEGMKSNFLDAPPFPSLAADPFPSPNRPQVTGGGGSLGYTNMYDSKRVI